METTFVDLDQQAVKLTPEKPGKFSLTLTLILLLLFFAAVAFGIGYFIAKS